MRVVKRFVVSKKIEGMSFNTPRPFRRVSNAPPFTNTGVDFAGPLFVTSRGQPESERTSKAYVCLQTCASARAVQLELAPNLLVLTFFGSFSTDFRATKAAKKNVFGQRKDV